MRQARRWLLWKAIPHKDPSKKPRKVPFYCDGSPRQGALDTEQDRGRLTDLDTAQAVLADGSYTGLGFALGPDGDGNHWQGIDLDGTDQRPNLAALAARLPGYVERSPSGKGFHAIGCGRAFKSLGSNSTGIEAYAGGRYFTVTGSEGHGDLEDIAEFVTGTLAPMHSPPRPKTEASERPCVDTQDAVIRDLRSALASMRSDDRDLWVRMGLSLKTMGDQGRALWMEWSQSSEKFDPSDAARAWESFRPESTDHRAVFAEATRHGWTNPAKRKHRAEEPPPPPGADDYADVDMGTKQDCGGEWPKLEPLPTALSPVAPFDYDLLPDAFRAWIRDISERMQCPPDYPAVSAVVCLSAVVGRQIGVRPKCKDDWTVVPNLWGSIIGRPSLLKTPALQETLKGIDGLEAAARKQFEDEERHYKADLLVAEAEVRESKTEIAKALKAKDKDKAHQYALDAGREPETPVRRRYRTHDATVE